MLLNMPGSRFRRSASTRITQAPARVVAVVALLSLAAGLAPFSSSPASAEQVTLSGAIESQGGVGVVDPTSDEVVATTRAVRNGVYGLSVEAGVYTVRVIPPSGSFGSPIQLLGRSITTTTTLDVVLPREGDLALTGRVTDGDDNGAPGVSVTLDAVDGGAPLETATDGTGAYRVELPAGSYSLSLRCDVCSPASAIPDHLDLTTDSPLDLSVSTVVDLPIPAAAVTVQVDDAAGNPVAGADVTASGMTVDRASIGGVAYAGQTSDTAPVTGADGMTAFRLLRTDLGPTPGNYRFVASPPMGSGLAPSELDGVEVTGDGEVLLTLAADAAATPLPTATPSPSPTDTPTDTPTATPTSTAEAETTATVTPGITSTTTATAEATAMPTETPTPSPTETANPTPTFSLLPTSTPSSTPTTEPPPTDTPTAVPTPTSSPTVTSVPTSAPTSTPSPTASPTAPPTPESAPGLDIDLSAPSGQPLPAACFHLYRAEEDGRRGEDVAAACDADGDGLTSFDGLLVGRFLVAIAHPAAGHRFVDDVPVELAGSGRVTLRIVSPPGGASVVVTSVTAAGLRYGESCFGLFATGPTGGDAPRHLESVCDGADWTTVFGDVEFDGLPSGHYRLLRFTEAEGYLTTETQHDFEMTPDERDVRLGHELGAPSTATSTVTPDPTTTSTPTDTPSVTPTASATAMPTGTPTATPTDTAVPTSTATHTGTPTPPSTSTGTPTSTPDATGTPTVRSTATRAATPTGTPPPITPNVALSKTKSKYNGAVVASLSGFTPNSVVTLRWPDGSRLAATTVDAAGSGSVAFPTPLAPLGTYRVEARDGAGKSARASLSVIPRIMLNIDEGWSSTRIRVYLYGYAAGERVEVRWYTTNGSSYVVVKTVAIASTGRGSSLVDIPARTGVGTHKVMGRVVGVARSASTTFRVTRAASGSEPPAPIGTATAAATPTPTVTATATPTPIVPTATPTAAPMPSPEPSSTPTATPTQEPIATATPTATITPAPESTIEPTPEPTTVPETTSDATPAPTPEQA